MEIGPLSDGISRFHICHYHRFAGLICGPLTDKVSAANTGPVCRVGCYCARLQGSVQEHFAPCLCSHLWSFVSGHFPQTPPGADGSPHPTTLSPNALDSPVLSTSRLAVPIPHLNNTTGQNKERSKGGGGFIVCLQRSAKQMTVSRHQRSVCSRII